MSEQTPLVESFRRKVLKNQAIPEDLRLLLLNQLAYGSDIQNNPLGQLRVILPDEDVGLRDNSYLNENDRANPDTMANVTAIGDVMKLATVVIEFEDGEILGYWHGPEGTPILEAPLMMMNTEGQIFLCAGRNISEAVLFFHTFGDPDRIAARRAALANLGIQVAAQTELELARSWEGKSDPGLLHQQLYEQQRKA